MVIANADEWTSEAGIKNIDLLIMHREYYIFELPSNPDSCTIWRYMDLYKFEDLLASETLYMSSIMGMSDEFEAEIPKHIGEYFIEQARLKDGEKAAKGWKIITEPNERLKKETFLSSWNIQENESYAMWKIYTKQTKSAIAIKSTVEKLISSFQNESELTQYIGKIRYHDGKSYTFRGNLFDPIMYKWNYYQFENELRVVTSYHAKDNIALKNHPKFIKPLININTLIESIYLSPMAGKDEFNHVKNLMESKGLVKDIYKSGIREKW